MKLRIILFSIVVFTLISCNKNEEVTTLKTKNDSLSYAIGMNIGQTFKLQKLDSNLNLDVLKAALKIAFTGDTSKLILKKDDIQKIFTELQKTTQEKQAKEQELKGSTAKKAGEEFLAKNKSNPKIKTTASGLQYEVISEGKGPKPTLESTVRVHYKGTFLDGKVFDSSLERGQPIEFPLANVIKGWSEGVQLMPVGSKYKLYVPSELAYGPQGAGPIGPNETLIFEVELIDIVKK